jgi:hypothetical protein
MARWKLDELECRNCREKKMRDMTAKRHHDHPERILWCLYCGAVCTACEEEPIGSDDWYTPEATCDPENKFRQPLTGRNV